MRILGLQAAEDEHPDAKRCKSAKNNGADKDSVVKQETEQNIGASQKKGKENNAKPPEPPKDYIHVRARRGQATDSHSLAERVSKERFSHVVRSFSVFSFPSFKFVIAFFLELPGQKRKDQQENEAPAGSRTGLQ